MGHRMQPEAPLTVAEVYREGGFLDATFDKRRAKLDGMEASDAKRLREPESENPNLKDLLAEARLVMRNDRIREPRLSFV